MGNLKLREYQIEDVKFLLKNDCSGCFNEQRTGKTPTSLSCIKERNLQDSKVLIVTTSSALYQWKAEYERWVEKSCIVCDGTPKQKEQKIKDWSNGLVISYGSIKTTSASQGCIDMILKQKPAMVIADEAHQFRNPKTCVAKSMFKLTKVPIRMALTGTPAYGTPKDIYCILHFLYPKRFTSPYYFYDYYFKREEINLYVGGHLRKIVDYKTFLPNKEKELQNFLNTCCTQRKRKEVMQWLPEKDKETISLPLTKEQTKYLTDLEEVYETENIVTMGILDRMVRYRQICLDPGLLNLKGKSPKTEWILNFIEENPNTPLIIFSNFTMYLQKLFDTLQEKKIKEAMIIGEVPSKVRNHLQDDFQSGKFNVFLINTMAGKEALTLDRAEAIIFSDVYPPIGAIEQAEDRFIATTESKKDKPHTIYYLAMQNSFDEHILKLLKDRKSETEVINNFKVYIKKGVKHE